MGRIILITGGQRSGKSTYAEQMALKLSPQPVYVATAHIWDDEFRERVRIHQKRRGPEWTNLEKERQLSQLQLPGRVILIDCVTLWATNFFFDFQSDVKQPLSLSPMKSVPAEYPKTESNGNLRIYWDGRTSILPPKQRKSIGWFRVFLSKSNDTKKPRSTDGSIPSFFPACSGYTKNLPRKG